MALVWWAFRVVIRNSFISDGNFVSQIKDIECSFKRAPIKLFYDKRVKSYGQKKPKFMFCCTNYAAPCKVSLAIISHPSDDELLCQLDVELFDDFDVDIGVNVAAVDHEPPFQNHLAAGEPALGLNRCLEVGVNFVNFR